MLRIHFGVGRASICTYIHTYYILYKKAAATARVNGHAKPEGWEGVVTYLRWSLVLGEGALLLTELY
jgi:hypothetical protein